MKGIIEEYGKIVVTVLVLAVLIGYIFYPGGFFIDLAAFAPKDNIKKENASEQLVNYSNILKPVLEITPQKLEADVSYDLLSFVTKAESNSANLDEDGNAMPVRSLEVNVIKITDPSGKKLDVPSKIDGKIMMSFAAYELDPENDDYTVGYRVTYEIVDKYYPEHPITTTTVCQFVVN